MDDNGESEEEEVFEIVDYTSASPWERFVATLESQLISWELSEGRLPLTTSRDSLNPWKEKETVYYGSRAYSLEFFAMDHSVKDMEKTPLSIPDNIRDGSRRHLWKRLWRQSPKVVVKDWDFLPVSEFAEDQPPGNISNKALIDAKLYSSQLHRWLGLTFFLLLRPLAMDRFGQEGEVRNYSSDILLPGQIPTSQDFDHHKMLLSSFHIALQNTGCCIPAFVQLGHSSKIIVHGIGFLQGDKGFNFVNMPSITPYGSGYHFSNYTKHTGYASQDPTDVISSAYLYRFKTYLIRHGSLHKNSQALSRFFTAQMSRDIFLESDTYVVEKNLIDGITVAELSTYDAPFGPKSEWEMKNFTSPGSRNDRAKPLGFTEDPVTFIRLQLYASSQLVDSPTDVSDWTVTVQYRHEVYKLPMLADSLNEILRDWLPQLCDNDGDLLDEDQRQLDGSNETLEKTLSRTDSGETTTLRAMHIGRKAVLSALGTETRNLDLGRDVGVVDMLEVQDAFSSLFPYSKDRIYSSAFDYYIKQTPEAQDTEENAILDSVLSRVRDAVGVPQNSFLWEFCSKILDSISPLTNTRLKTRSDGFAKTLWGEVTRELRSRWDTGVLVPFVFSGEADRTAQVIDLHQSLLHQKLYMLNSCIVRKKSPVTRRVTPHTDESPSRGSKASNTGKQREGMVSILSNLASQTIGDMSSVGFYGNGYKGKTLTEGAGAIIENFFDRITAEDAQKAPLSSSIPEHVVGTPHSGLLSLNGASSWSSDRSWEMYAGHIDKRNREKFTGGEVKSQASEGSPRKSQDDMFFDPEGRDTESTSSSYPAADVKPKSLLKKDDLSFGSPANGLMESFIELGDDFTVEKAESVQDGRGSILVDTDGLDVEPEGVAEESSGILLLNGEPMRIPNLQENCLMTEDMILEQERIFEKLGASAEATKIRARMQCAQLKSDMEAFKAANPRCSLADFVRWHSPRDWIEDSKGGRLSSRMKDPGNLWDEIWKASKRIPSNRQKPLFNIETEAEKVLFFFETLPTPELFAFLIPIIFLVAFHEVASHPLVAKIPHVKSEVIVLGNELTKTSWRHLRFSTMTDLLSRVALTERHLSLSISLSKKLPLQYGLISRLVGEGFSKADTPSEKDTIWELLADVSPSKSPVPVSKEYLFRCNVIGRKKRLIRQRMYAMLRHGETRIVTTLVDPKCMYL